MRWNAEHAFLRVKKLLSQLVNELLPPHTYNACKYKERKYILTFHILQVSTRRGVYLGNSEHILHRPAPWQLISHGWSGWDWTNDLPVNSRMFYHWTTDQVWYKAPNEATVLSAISSFIPPIYLTSIKIWYLFAGLFFTCTTIWRTYPTWL